MIIHTDDRPIGFTMETGSPTQRLEPITLALAKLQARFPSAAEDLLLPIYLVAARTYFEEQSGRQCVDATWEYGLDGVPDERVIQLPRPPLASVVEVTYDDAAGAAQIFDAANYTVHESFDVPPGSPAQDPVIDPYCPCGRIELVAGASWPVTSGLARSLRIRRVCGYGATAEVMPLMIQAALLLLFTHFHRNRQEVVDVAQYQLPLGAQALISAFKWTALPTIPPTRLTFPY